MSYNKKPKTIDPNEVDPSVYYYDEVYDDMKEEEEESKQTERDRAKRESDKSKGSLYIKRLQESAEIRKTEKDLRRFKKYARDNEETKANSGEEVYVTAGYKRKLKEMKLLEEDKRRRLESEKDNTMNFLKRYKSDISDNKKAESRQQTPPRDNPKASTSKPPDDDRNAHNKDSGQSDNSKEMVGPQAVKPKRELKTFKEKRDYLRKVLAKRTVGKVFEEAVARYKKRKATSVR